MPTTNLSAFLSSSFSGSQGGQGVQGTLGTQGSQGLQGGLGAQGSQGVQGLSNQGIQGTQGLQGGLGAQGSQGVQGLSNQGIQGTQGIQGIAGSGSAVTITDETTNATRYVGFTTVTSGTATELRISSSRLTYNPSTSTLFTDGAVAIGATDSATQNFSIEFNEAQDTLDFVYTA